MERPSRESDEGAVTTMTATPSKPDYTPPGRPGPTPPPPASQTSAFLPSMSKPGLPAADPDVAATVRLLHRRQGWSRTAVTSFFAFLLAYGAYANAESQGAPAPAWFLDMIIALGALTAVGIVAAVIDTALLRRRPPKVRAQAAPLAAHHPIRPHAHHYPPRHLVTWALRWAGMLVILVVAVVSVPAVVDGTAYLAGAGKRSPSIRSPTRQAALSTAARRSRTASWRPAAPASARAGRTWSRSAGHSRSGSRYGGGALAWH